MTTINNLSAEERKALMAELSQQEKAEKLKIKQDKIAFKQLSNSYVEKFINPLSQHQIVTELMIKDLFADYNAILALKASVYGATVKDQESHTSTLPDGSASITIGHNISIGFDGTESAGVAKIKEFINSLSSEEDNVKKLTAAVNTFLQPNRKTGMLNPAKIIQLSKLRDEFNDSRFDDGLEIIFSAQQRRIGTMYVSGWNFMEIEGIRKKVEFRFTL